MPKEIECPVSLEESILWGDQIPYYRSISGEPDPRRADKETIDYYHQGKKYAEQFDKGKDFLESLKAHIEKCKKCSAKKQELKRKYQIIKQEELNKLEEQERANLKYFGLLD